MSKFEKLKERILTLPSDFTYSETKTLLKHLGFKEKNKGKTSGARICFFREYDQRIILLHKPHPGDVVKRGALRNLVDQLKEWGEL